MLARRSGLEAFAMAPCYWKDVQDTHLLIMLISWGSVLCMLLEKLAAL